VTEYRISFTVELESPPDVSWLGKGPLKDWTVEEVPPVVVEPEPEPEPEPAKKTYRVSFLVTLEEGQVPSVEWLGKEVDDFKFDQIGPDNTLPEPEPQPEPEPEPVDPNAPHPDNTLPGDLPPNPDDPHPDNTLPGDLPPDARRGGRRRN
jgi:hypothetical protein